MDVTIAVTQRPTPLHCNPAASGTGQQARPVRTFHTAFKGTPSARQGTTLRPGVTLAGREGSGVPLPGQRGEPPTRWPRAEAHRVPRCRRSAPPHPKAAGTHSNAPPVTAPAQLTGPPSPRRAFCRRAKITVKGAPKGASPAAMAQAPTLDTDLRAARSGASRKDGPDSTRPPHHLRLLANPRHFMIPCITMDEW